MNGCLAIASLKLEASSVSTDEGSSLDSPSSSALTEEIEEKTKKASKTEQIKALDLAAIWERELNGAFEFTGETARLRRNASDII